MTIDPIRVINFLKIKRVLDPTYSNIIINDSPEMVAMLHELQNTILDSVLIGDDDNSRQAEKTTTELSPATPWAVKAQKSPATTTTTQK